MPPCTLLGYARELARGPSLDWQRDLLTKAGVTEQRLYVDEIPKAAGRNPRRMFGEICRASRAGDCFVVPCFGIFARNRTEISASLRSLELRSIGLWSIEDKLDTRTADPEFLFHLDAANRAAVGIWNRERTEKASRARKYSNRLGPRPKLSPRREAEARALWLDPDNEQTNKEIADQFGMSVGRLGVKFGARPRNF